MAALNLRVEDVFSRLNEVELGIDTASRGGVALRLRFEQMQSSAPCQSILGCSRPLE